MLHQKQAELWRWLVLISDKVKTLCGSYSKESDSEIIKNIVDEYLRLNGFELIFDENTGIVSTEMKEKEVI